MPKVLRMDKLVKLDDRRYTLTSRTKNTTSFVLVWYKLFDECKTLYKIMQMSRSNCCIDFYLFDKLGRSQTLDKTSKIAYEPFVQIINAGLSFVVENKKTRHSCTFAMQGPDPVAYLTMAEATIDGDEQCVHKIVKECHDPIPGGDDWISLCSCL